MKRFLFLLLACSLVIACPIRKEEKEITTELLGNDTFWQKKFPNGIPNDYLNEEYYIKKASSDVSKSLRLVSQQVAGDRTPTLVYTFDKKLDFASVLADSITVTNRTTSDPVAFSILTDESEPYVLKIAISQMLSEKTEYLVEISSISDIAGISTALSINFFTPTFSILLSSYPLDFGYIYSNEFIVLDFLKEIVLDPSSITDSSIYIVKESDNTTVSASTFEFDAANNRVTLSANMEHNTKYIVKITTAVKYEENSSFVNIKKERSVVFTNRAKADFVKSLNPVSGASGKSADFKLFIITLADDIELDENSVIPFNCYFKSIDNPSKTMNVWDMSYNKAAKTVVIEAEDFEDGMWKLIFGAEFSNKVAVPDINYVFRVSHYGKFGSNFNEFTNEVTYGTDSNDPNYVVIMRDDFNKGHYRRIQKNDGSWYECNNSPDPKWWDHIGEFAGNNSCRPENAYVQDGKLIIKAENQNYQFYGQPFAMMQRGNNDMAGRVQTKERFGFLYGKVSAKFKLAGGNTWPAIWLLANNEQSANEIDFIEYYPYANGRRWDVVIHKNFNKTNVGYNNGFMAGPGESLYNYDIVGTLNWSETTPNTGNSTIRLDADFYKNGTKMVSNTICNLNGQGYYQAPMYPIVEIQQGNRCWVGSGDRTFKSTETLEVDWIQVSQPKNSRYATFVDPLYNLDNSLSSDGVVVASYIESAMQIDGIDIGEFFYKGQPRYETSLLKATSSNQYIIYKAKNIKGIYITAYYPKELVNYTKDGNLAHSTSLKNGANAFSVELGSTLAGSFTSCDITLENQCNGAASWYKDTWETDASTTKDYNKMVQLYFYNTNIPARQYNYVKINFPQSPTDGNGTAIYLGVVVITRYEGTDYADYKMEGEL